MFRLKANKTSLYKLVGSVNKFMEQAMDRLAAEVLGEELPEE